MNSYRTLMPVFIALMIMALSQITFNGASVMAAPVQPEHETISRNQSSSVDMTIHYLTDEPDPILAGEAITYKVLFLNSSQDTDATNVVLTFALPLSVTYNPTASTSNSRCSLQSGNIVECSWDDIPALQAGFASITVDVDSAARDTVTTEATVTSDQSDPDLSNNSQSVQTSIHTESDLSVSKSDAPDPVIAGEQVTYTLTVHNAGPSAAPNVILTDILPSSLTLNSASASQGSCANLGSNDTCDLGQLEPNSSATVTIVADVDPLARESISNTATVASDESDPDTDNNTISEETTINAETDLTLTKSSQPNPVVAGGSLTYILTVHNDGPSTATGVQLTDSLPATITFTSSSLVCTDDNGIVGCPLGTLDVGETATVTLVTQVDRSVTETIVNSAQVTSLEGGYDNTTHESETEGPPEVIIDQIMPNSTFFGQIIEFKGSGITDTVSTTFLEDGYEWKLIEPEQSCVAHAGLLLADSARFLTNSIVPGDHKVCLRAQNQDGVWSNYKSEMITVRADRDAYSDIAVGRDDVTFFIAGMDTEDSKISNPSQGDYLDIEVKVSNISLVDTPDEVKIFAYDGDLETGVLIGEATIDFIATDSDEVMRIPWHVGYDANDNPLPDYSGYHIISVDIEYEENVTYFANNPEPPYYEPHLESSYDNNRTTALIVVGEPDPGTYQIGITANINPYKLYTGYTANLSGDAEYDWGSHLPTMGADVSIEIVDANGATQSVYNTHSTAPFGRYISPIQLPPTPGIYTATIQVFDENLRSETSLEFQVFEPPVPPPPMPDLLVQRYSVSLDGPGIYYRGSNRYNITGKPITVTARILNQGDLAVTTPFTVSLYDGSPYLATPIRLVTDTISHLAAGDSIMATFVWTPTVEKVSHLQVIVDWPDKIPESNDDNNYDNWYYRYRGYREKVDIRDAGPDLRAQGLSYERKPSFEDVISLTVDIGNIGHLSAAQDFTVKYYDGYPGMADTRELNAVSESDPDRIDRVEQSLLVGETLTSHFLWDTSLGRAEAGLHHICVVVDTGEEVDEEFETNNNNCWNIEVYPSGHDLWPVGIWFSNNGPQHNTPISITATIRNRGADPFTGTETVNFYTSHPDNDPTPIGTATISGPINGRDATGTTTSISWTTPDLHGSAYIYAEIVVDGVSHVDVRRLNVYPDPPPDLRILSEDIHVSNREPVYGEEVSLSVDIKNVTGANTATDVFVRFYTDSGQGFVPLGSPRPISSIAPGQTITVSANATFIAVDPYYAVKVEAWAPTDQGDRDWRDNEATTSLGLVMRIEHDDSTPLCEAVALTADLPDGDEIFIDWDFGDGRYDFSNSTTSHQYDDPGVYTVTATTRNWPLEPQLSDTTLVTITDCPIEGLQAVNDGSTQLEESTTLNATISAGSNVTYEWEFGDGESATGAEVTHTYDSVGTYTATVSATNGEGTLEATTEVTIRNVSIAGLAAHNDGSTTLSETTTLSATLTAGTDVTYSWDFGDGSSATGVVVTHTYSQVGVYTATITASNPVGTEEATTVVEITDIGITGLHATNDSPTLLGETTTLTATIATGTHVTYEWELGDGTSASGAVVTHGYSNMGPYTAVVTATNSVGTVMTTTEVSILPTESVILVLNPPTITTGLGETFELPIEVWAGIQPVDGATTHLNYDPTYLEVVSIAAGEDFSAEFLNQFDNESGELDYAAGSFNGFPNGTFNLATVTFKTKALTDEAGSPIDFNMTLPRLSDATFDGVTVFSDTINSTIFVEKSAVLALEPLTITALVGETFEMPILVQAGTQPVDAASAYLNFDSSLLKVVSITPDSELPNVLANSFDNSSGELEFAAGIFTEPYPTGTFTLATVTFRTFGSTEGTPITFNRTAPRQSNITFGGFGGTSVLKETNAGSTVIVPKIVIMALSPPTMTVDMAQPFEIAIQIEADSQQVNGAEVTLTFDSALMEVATITPGSDLPNVITSTFDNSSGQLEFAADSTSAASSTFTLATVTFTATAQTDGTSIDFGSLSDASYDDATVLSDTTGSEITIRSANVIASVNLQGRPAPPHEQWSVPLRVSFTKVGESSPAYEFTPTTDNSGTFTITNQIAPGSYDVRVKKPNSLQNTTTFTLSAGSNPLDLGTLLEGDTDDNNYVTLVDFSLLVSTFAKCDGMADYDARADFNSDNCVNILDFSLLVSNFAQGGDMRPEGRAAEGRAPSLSQSWERAGVRASLIIDHPIIQAQTGNSYRVAVSLAADSPVDGAAAYIDFDASLLKVNSITAGDTFDLELQNEFDNQTGMVLYGAGTLTPTPPLPGGEGLGVRAEGEGLGVRAGFDLMIIELEAIGNGESPLLFQFDAPRSTDVTSGGQSVLSDYVDGSDASIPTAVEVAQISARGRTVATGWMALLVMGALLVIGIGRRWMVPAGHDINR